MHEETRVSRPGWVRDVELPRSLDELRGSTTGVVRLPLRLYWSGPDPERVEWDAGSPERRARLYNGAALVSIWDRLYLPPWLRAAWTPLVDAARGAA